MSKMSVLTLERLQEYNEELEQRYTRQTSFNSLSGEVTQVKRVIEILQGAGDGSIQKTVADAIAAIVDSAPGEFDTLRELAEWINSHQQDATGMNRKINENEQAIQDLKNLVGSIPPEGEDPADTIVAYIQQQVSQCVKTADLVAITSEEIQALFEEE